MPAPFTGADRARGAAPCWSTVRARCAPRSPAMQTTDLLSGALRSREVARFPNTCVERGLQLTASMQVVRGVEPDRSSGQILTRRQMIDVLLAAGYSSHPGDRPPTGRRPDPHTVRQTSDLAHIDDQLAAPQRGLHRPGLLQPHRDGSRSRHQEGSPTSPTTGRGMGDHPGPADHRRTDVHGCEQDHDGPTPNGVHGAPSPASGY